MAERRRKAKPGDWAALVGAVVVAILLVVGYEIRKHEEGPPVGDAALAAIAPRSPEADLTRIQLGRRPRRFNSTLKRLAGLLDILEADCPGNTRRDLADLTVTSLRALQRSGSSTATPTQVLGGVLGAQSMGAAADCSGFFERYVARVQNEK